VSFLKIVKEGAVARLELCRPPLNILNIEFLEQLDETLQQLAQEPALACLVLHSSQKAFSAGADIREHLPDQACRMLKTFHKCLLSLVRFPVPTVALIEGAALGGGCELALCCDFRLLSQAASLGQPEIQVGVFPPVACLLLPELMPKALAWEVVLGGRPLQAEECGRWGLAHAVLAPDQFAEEAERFVARLTCHSPQVLRLTKKALQMNQKWLDRLEQMEQLYLQELMQQPDALEGLQSFLEKRPPQWSRN